MSCGIYGIHNLANGKWYVGQAVNIKKRWTSHRWVICTPFTGHPVEGVLLCGTHMSTKGNV